MAQNLYATLTDFKTKLGISSTTNDALHTDILHDASRMIDNDCGRYFYTEVKTRYLDTQDSASALVLPFDLHSVTTLTTDSEFDETHDGETWTQGTDFVTWPYESYPKSELRTINEGNYAFAKNAKRYVKLIGVWGFGNGTSNPWLASGVTITVANTTSTTITTSADTLQVGQTIRAGTEDLYVSAVATGSITATRGVNGSTASAHSTAAATIAQYPVAIRRAVMEIAARWWRDRLGNGDLQSERLGDYQYRRFSPDTAREHDRRMYSTYRRVFGL